MFVNLPKLFLVLVFISNTVLFIVASSFCFAAAFDIFYSCVSYTNSTTYVSTYVHTPTPIDTIVVFVALFKGYDINYKIPVTMRFLYIEVYVTKEKQGLLSCIIDLLHLSPYI